MRSAYVTGIGMSEFGKFPDVALPELAADAVIKAMTDSDARDFDAIYIGNVYESSGVGSRVLSRLALTGRPIVTIEAACASGTVAFAEAHWGVVTGRYDTVLVLGCEQLSSRFSGGIHPSPWDPEGRTGLVLPALYAMAANRYVDFYGLRMEQLAAVSVKNHANGARNPRAQYKREVTLDEVLQSPMIADPLTLLQCCPISDGAAAVIISSQTRRDTDVRVAACRTGSGKLWDYSSPYAWSFDLMQRVASQIYDDLHITPADIDVFEVHDAFTIGEILATEALGLAEVGEGGALLESHATQIGGKHAVNPSGGLLSKGHPLGATGISQIGEVTLQLRGEAGDCQVDGARRGLVETMGGGVAMVDGNACAVIVLER
jgi:acetyl-CoA acetyltransferase